MQNWIKCSERMPEVDIHCWRTAFPLLVNCEVGVIPAYYGYAWYEGEKYFGFMHSLRYGIGDGSTPNEGLDGFMSDVTHWQPRPEPPND